MAEAIDEILTESEVRRVAYSMLALDGHWGVIISAEGKQKGNQLLEEALDAEIEKIRSRPGVSVLPDNSLPGYGIDEKDLYECFSSRTQGDKNFYLLRQICRGIFYVETEGVSGIPHEILSAENTFEILSNYRAFGKLIKDDCIKTDDWKTTREELKEMPAELVVSKMVSYGCRYAAMVAMRQKGYIRFPTESGDLIKRIKPLSKQVKDKFMQLLDIPEPEVPQLTKKEYIETISEFMHKLYKRNTSKKHK
ncbi:hypothetical protein KY343_00205 [Candidatus Woesearchaeota archaeon]|nr:hypothetical protein [Candidatus Woesearchaeota archaeon]